VRFPPSIVSPVRHRLLVSGAGLALLFFALPVWAQATAPSHPWREMALHLVGGLALFLFGMEYMTTALKAAAGERMRQLMAGLTYNRFVAAFSGALITGIVQSSSVTTVLTVGFVATHLLSLHQAIGLIMGANIGSTVTAQIIAFNITDMGLLMIAGGLIVSFASRQDRGKQIGNVIMGLGLIFFGMHLMGEAMRPLRDYPPFLEWMQNLREPWLGILVAALFTALVQSSAATIGLAIVMATQGLVSLEAGIALMFGANIGTCVTALLAAVGKPREAVRVAVVHVLFNVLGVLLWLGLIEQLILLTQMVSPSSPIVLQESIRRAADVPRQIANANTLFNIINTLVFIGFSGMFARVALYVVPERSTPTSPGIKPRYLTPLLFDTPTLALDAVRMELQRMGQRVEKMFSAALPVIVSGNQYGLERLAARDGEIDIIHAYVVEYLGEISKRHLSDEQTRELMRLLNAANSLEQIGDIIEIDLVTLGQQRIQEDIRISTETQALLANLHSEVLRMVILASEAVTSNDRDKAAAVLAQKDLIDNLLDQAGEQQARRLIEPEGGRVAAYGLETDIMEKFRRVFYFTRRIAKSVL
jgi:phosphate:Na+ symporter